jgi:hypothetical protein
MLPIIQPTTGVYVGTHLETAISCAQAMFLCALFNVTGARVDSIYGGGKMVRTPEYLVPLAVGFVKHMPIVTLSPFPMRRPMFAVSRAWPKLFDWGQVVNDPSVGGRIDDLKSVATTERVKIRGQYCSIAQLLRTYALRK